VKHRVSSRRRVTSALAVTIVVGVFGSFVAAGAAAAAAPSTRHKGAAEATATLKILEPNVSIQRKGKDAFKPAKDGQRLRVGDTVQTDATGFAQIDYTDDSFTRLDVNTTFTIESLTDDAGNRQIKGHLESGQTWNRTTALTESESFEQEGAGATAAVTGTVFAASCATPLNCTFYSLVHGITLTTVDGEIQNLDPLEVCDSTELSDTDANLCDEVAQLTLDAILANHWMLENLFIDGVNGFEGIVIAENGQVSVTPTPPSTPPQDETPPAVGACGIPTTDPATHFDGSPGTGAPPSTLGGCPMTAFGDDTRSTFSDVTTVNAPGGGSLSFSTPLNHREIGDGWNTWSHDYTGDVYFLPGGGGGDLVAEVTALTVTITLPSGTLAFSFYAEPNSFEGSFTVTATLQDGTTSNAVPVAGNAGATYFGFYTTSLSNPLVSIDVSSDDSDGFAIGEFMISQTDQAPAVVAGAATPDATEPEPAASTAPDAPAPDAPAPDAAPQDPSAAP
jgi:hypothetical protein